METSTPEETPLTENPTNYGLIAEQRFGSDYHGEAVEPQVTTEQPIEPVEEPKEELPEVPVEASEESPEPMEAEEETTISTLSQVLEAEGYDQGEFMSLEVEQKIDGETRKVKLSDVIATNQTLAAADKRLEEVKEKAKSQNQALAAREQELDQTFEVAGAILKDQATQLDAKKKAHETDPLRQQDPAEWAAKDREIDREIQSFQQKVLGFSNAYQQQKTKSTEESEQALQARLVKEKESLLELLPEWKDEDVMSKEQEQLASYLVGQDLTPESYETVLYDHKLFLMARKAAKYDEIQSRAEPAKKKLRKVPKTLKPGSKPASVDPNKSEIDDLQAQLDANPNHRDATSWAAKIVKLRRGN
jgi:hypothetical protein